MVVVLKLTVVVEDDQPKLRNVRGIVNKIAHNLRNGASNLRNDGIHLRSDSKHEGKDGGSHTGAGSGSFIDICALDILAVSTAESTRASTGDSTSLSIIHAQWGGAIGSGVEAVAEAPL